GQPQQMALDAEGRRAFVIFAGDDVAAINMDNLQVVDSMFIKRTFNAIGYSKKDQLLYLAQSKGLAQPGQVIRYNLQGTAVDSFATGISPIGFQFVKSK